MSITFYFLQNCFILLCGYIGLNKILEKTSEKYILLTHTRKLYVLKNLIKSLILCYLTVCKYHVFGIIFTKNWHNETIYKYASNYIANDFLGLLLNKNLPKNTQYHHITSVILYIYLINQDFNNNIIARLIFVYGTFSSISFIVNFYLGIRLITADNVIYDNEKILNNIRLAAYYIYNVGCMMNLLSHVYLIYFEGLSIQLFVYLCALIPIINDDIILIHWLKKKYVKKIKNRICLGCHNNSINDGKHNSDCMLFSLN